LSGFTDELLTVADIARRSGVAVSHVRYYEREGLLPAPDRILDDPARSGRVIDG